MNASFVVSSLESQVFRIGRMLHAKCGIKQQQPLWQMSKQPRMHSATRFFRCLQPFVATWSRVLVLAQSAVVFVTHNIEQRSIPIRGGPPPNKYPLVYELITVHRQTDGYNPRPK